VGFDAEQTRGFLKQTQTGETRGSPFLVGTIPSGKHYDYDVTATVAAAFAQYDWPVSEDLLVTLGLRAERVDYDYDNRMISGRTKDDGTACGFGGCRYNRPESRSDAFNNLSPKLGFNYAFGQHSCLVSSLRASEPLKQPSYTGFRMVKTSLISTQKPSTAWKLVFAGLLLGFLTN